MTTSCPPDIRRVPASGCISLIGMAAAGKTTMARELSVLLGWPCIDTDHIIEAVYGTRLQAIADRLTKDEFLDIEAQTICGLFVQRTIISTGGSVVYRPQTIAHLASLGPLIHLDVPFPIIMERIARKPDRGLAIAPGQTIEDLYNERQELYMKSATVSFSGGRAPAACYAREIAQWLWSGDE